MAQRLGSLVKWQYLPEGDALEFLGTKIRTVRIDVNCPTEVAFYVLQDTDNLVFNPARVRDVAEGRAVPDLGPEEKDKDSILKFVGLCKGLDRLEFGVSGRFKLLAEGGGVYVYSNDGQEIHSEVLAPVIFTRIANRKERNPHLEMMQYQMRLNQQRMERAMFEEVDRRMQALEERTERHVEGRGAAAVVRTAPETTEPVRREIDESPSIDARHVAERAEDSTEGGRSKPADKKQPKATKPADI